MVHTRILLAASLILLAQGTHAYQIVEGRYKVETAPGVFEDQLVVRCDDGRTLTVAWETKLAEACGEGLMGERTGTPGKPKPAAATAPAEQATPAVDTAAASGGLFDDAAQKQAMLAQIRSQFGDVPERYIEFKPGPDGLSMRLLPPLNEIVKKYEACRRARQPGSHCAAERDRAIGSLNQPGIEAASAAAPPSAAAPRPNPGHNGAQDKPAMPDAPAAANAATAVEAEAAAPNADAGTKPQADTGTKPQAETPTTPAADRAAMEQEIAEQHALCMRLKPKFECEQARARALSKLDRPKATKPVRPAKQVKAASGQVAAAAER